MLIFIRCSAFLITSPIFIIRGIPPLVKAGFAFTLALIIFPLVPENELIVVGGFWDYGLMVLSETAVGLAMGLMCTIIFNIIRMAGQMIDFQIGFAMSQVMDPASGSVNTLLGRFLYFVTLATFFSMDGHHGLIWGLVNSYQILPLGTAEISGSATEFFVRVLADSLIMALKVAMPVVAALLMTDMALGVMGRAAPQMNVFMLGFPFKIMFGLVSLAILLPLLGVVFTTIFDQMQRDLLILIRELS